MARLTDEERRAAANRRMRRGGQARKNIKGRHIIQLGPEPSRSFSDRTGIYPRAAIKQVGKGVAKVAKAVGGNKPGATSMAAKAKKKPAIELNR